MENIGGDAPFGGDYGTALTPDDFFPNRQTDRIMAFDVSNIADADAPFTTNVLEYGGNTNPVDRVRKVALFEGMDEIGRLQPLLGTAEPAFDEAGSPINWPATPEYQDAGLVGQMEGSIAWHSPTTENPELGSTEIWEIYNATGDAHPVHLHLVNFEVLDRHEFTAEVVDQKVVQHNGLLGAGFRLENIVVGAEVPQPAGYVENAPKDMVTALPEQVTRIRAHFDKPGRYVWHCHILSHEDHEMMRVLHVGPGSQNAMQPMAKQGSLKNAELNSAELNKPLTFEIRQNYPNPFNPSTTIDFTIPSDERVRMDIYSSSGRLVKNLVRQNYSAGSHSVKWNGKNNWGRKVSSGMYIYRIKAGNYTKTLKMKLLR